MAQPHLPYSGYGLGEKQITAFDASKSMGGISAGLRQPFNINYRNPASYSAIQAATMEVGAYLNLANLQHGDSSYRSLDASLDYLALGFPISKKWGMSFGILPYSIVRYSYENDTTLPEIGYQKNEFVGEGRLYQAYLGNAYRFGNFSLGLNVGYLFGRIDHSQLTTIPDSTEIFGSRNLQVMRPQAFYWNVGLQYRHEFGRSDTTRQAYELITGVYGQPSYKIATDYTNLWQRIAVIEDRLAILDTVSLDSEKSKNVRLPLEIGVGATFGKPDNWIIGADMVYTSWEEFESPFLNDALVNSFQLRVGAEYVPDILAVNSLKSRIRYHLGFHYDNGRLQLNDTRIADYGMTFGLSIPVKKSLSQVHMALDVGSRGSNKAGLINENYVNFQLGFTLSDNEWFRRRKIQ